LADQSTNKPAGLHPRSIEQQLTDDSTRSPSPNPNEQHPELAALRQRVQVLEALQTIAMSISGELELEALLVGIIRSANQILDGEACSLMLADREREELVFHMVEGGGGGRLVEQRMPLSRGIAGWVVTHATPVVVNDVTTDARFAGDIAQSVNFQVRSLVAVPMMRRGRAIGVLEVLNKRGEGHFTDNDAHILYALASQAAIAIENARLYQELREERDRIIRAEEEVRRQLHREIHDGPAQVLATVAMRIGIIERWLDRDSAMARTELHYLDTLVRESLADTRRLLFDLRPLILETRGLVPAIQFYVSRFGRDSVSVVELDTDQFEGRLDPPIETTVYGIVQEAINNVIKHAHAHHLWITLRGNPQSFTLSIRDDGVGFDQDQAEKQYDSSGSFGLLNMRERASRIGGRLTLTSRPNQGTTVTLTVPG